jgi:hypothetical protein
MGSQNERETQTKLAEYDWTAHWAIAITSAGGVVVVGVKST